MMIKRWLVFARLVRACWRKSSHIPEDDLGEMMQARWLDLVVISR